MADRIEQKKKRKRSANWDSIEKHLLRTCMKEFIKIIENKNTDTNTNKNKNTAWIQLTQRFNELNDKERTLGEIKQQWRTMKLKKKEVSPYRRQGQKNLLQVDLAGSSKTEPILIEDSNNYKQETITTPSASTSKHGHQTSNNEAPDSITKELNSVLIDCIKEKHDLKMKQMIESHIWAKEESQLRIENLKLDIILKTKLIDK